MKSKGLKVAEGLIEENEDWMIEELVAGGYGIHWDELDDELTAGGFLTFLRT